MSLFWAEKMIWSASSLCTFISILVGSVVVDLVNHVIGIFSHVFSRGPRGLIAPHLLSILKIQNFALFWNQVCWGRNIKDYSLVAFEPIFEVLRFICIKGHVVCLSLERRTVDGSS